MLLVGLGLKPQSNRSSAVNEPENSLQMTMKLDEPKLITNAKALGAICRDLDHQHASEAVGSLQNKTGRGRRNKLRP